MVKKWIQKAIPEKNKGKFKEKAKKAGMSTAEFATAVLANKDKYSTTTVREAALAKRLMGLKKKKGGK